MNFPLLSLICFLIYFKISASTNPEFQSQEYGEAIAFTIYWYIYWILTTEQWLGKNKYSEAMPDLFLKSANILIHCGGKVSSVVFKIFLRAVLNISKISLILILPKIFKIKYSLLNNIFFPISPHFPFYLTDWKCLWPFILLEN